MSAVFASVLTKAFMDAYPTLVEETKADVKVSRAGDVVSVGFRWSDGETFDSAYLPTPADNLMYPAAMRAKAEELVAGEKSQAVRFATQRVR